MIQDLLNIYRGDKITLIPIRRSDSEGGFEPLDHTFSFNILDAVRYSHSTRFQPQNFLRMDLTKQDFVRNEPVVISVTGAFVTVNKGKEGESTARDQYRDVLERMREGRPMKFINRYLHNTTVVIKDLEVTMDVNEHRIVFQAALIHTFRDKISQTRPRIQTKVYVQPEEQQNKPTIKHIAKREKTTPEKIEEENRSCDIIQKRNLNIKEGAEVGLYQVTTSVQPSDTMNEIAAAVNTTPALLLKLNPFLEEVDYNTKLSESSLNINSSTLIVVGESADDGKYYGVRKEDDEGSLIQLTEGNNFSS